MLFDSSQSKNMKQLYLLIYFPLKGIYFEDKDDQLSGVAFGEWSMSSLSMVSY